MLAAANIQKRLPVEWAEKHRNVQFHKWVDVDEKWVSCYKPMGKFKIMPIMPRGMKRPQSRVKTQECEARTKSDVHHCHRSELD